MSVAQKQQKTVQRTFPKFDKNYRMSRETKILTRDMPKSVRKLFIQAEHEVEAFERTRGKPKDD